MSSVGGGEAGMGLWMGWAEPQAWGMGTPGISPLLQALTECHLGGPRLLLQPRWVPGPAHHGCDCPEPAPPLGDGEKGVSPGAWVFSHLRSPTPVKPTAEQSLLSLLQPLTLLVSARTSYAGKPSRSYHAGFPPLQNLSSTFVTQSCPWGINPLLCPADRCVNK